MSFMSNTTHESVGTPDESGDDRQYDFTADIMGRMEEMLVGIMFNFKENKLGELEPEEEEEREQNPADYIMKRLEEIQSVASAFAFSMNGQLANVAEREAIISQTADSLGLRLKQVKMLLLWSAYCSADRAAWLEARNAVRRWHLDTSHHKMADMTKEEKEAEIDRIHAAREVELAERDQRNAEEKAEAKAEAEAAVAATAAEAEAKRLQLEEDATKRMDELQSSHTNASLEQARASWWRNLYNAGKKMMLTAAAAGGDMKSALLLTVRMKQLEAAAEEIQLAKNKIVEETRSREETETQLAQALDEKMNKTNQLEEKASLADSLSQKLRDLERQVHELQGDLDKEQNLRLVTQTELDKSVERGKESRGGWLAILALKLERQQTVDRLVEMQERLGLAMVHETTKLALHNSHKDSRIAGLEDARAEKEGLTEKQLDEIDTLNTMLAKAEKGLETAKGQIVTLKSEMERSKESFRKLQGLKSEEEEAADGRMSALKSQLHISMSNGMRIREQGRRVAISRMLNGNDVLKEARLACRFMIAFWREAAVAELTMDDRIKAFNKEMERQKEEAEKATEAIQQAADKREAERIESVKRDVAIKMLSGSQDKQLQMQLAQSMSIWKVNYQSSIQANSESLLAQLNEERALQILHHQKMKDRAYRQGSSNLGQIACRWANDSCTRFIKRWYLCMKMERADQDKKIKMMDVASAMLSGTMGRAEQMGLKTMLAQWKKNALHDKHTDQLAEIDAAQLAADVEKEALLETRRQLEGRTRGLIGMLFADKWALTVKYQIRLSEEMQAYGHQVAVLRWKLAMEAEKGEEANAELELKVGELDESTREAEDVRVLFEDELRAKTALEEEIESLQTDLLNEKQELEQEIEKNTEVMERLEGELEEMRETMATMSEKLFEAEKTAAMFADLDQPSEAEEEEDEEAKRLIAEAAALQAKMEAEKAALEAEEAAAMASGDDEAIRRTAEKRARRDGELAEQRALLASQEAAAKPTTAKPKTAEEEQAKKIKKLMAKVKSLEETKEEVEAEKKACEEECVKLKFKLDLQIEQLRQMKDARPPDIKEFIAWAQGMAVKRSATVLGSWDRITIKNLLTPWRRAALLDLAGKLVRDEMEAELRPQIEAGEARLVVQKVLEAANSRKYASISFMLWQNRLLENKKKELVQVWSKGSRAEVEAAKAAAEMVEEAKLEAVRKQREEEMVRNQFEQDLNGKMDWLTEQSNQMEMELRAELEGARGLYSTQGEEKTEVEEDLKTANKRGHGLFTQMWFLLAKNRGAMRRLDYSRCVSEWVINMKLSEAETLRVKLREATARQNDTMIESSRLQGKMGALESKFRDKTEEFEDEILNLKRKMAEQNGGHLQITRGLTSMLVVQLVRHSAALPLAPMVRCVAEWRRQALSEGFDDTLMKKKADITKKGMEIMQLQQKLGKQDKQSSSSRNDLLKKIAVLEGAKQEVEYLLEQTQKERENFRMEKDSIVKAKLALDKRTEALTKTLWAKNLERLKNGIKDFFSKQTETVFQGVIASWKAKLNTWKIRNALAMSKLKSVINNDINALAAWQPRLAVPFQHWLDLIKRRLTTRRREKLEVELKKINKAYTELETEKDHAHTKAEEEKAFILQQAAEDLAGAKAVGQELAVELNRREEERLRILKTAQNTNNKFDEAEFRLQEERQQNIFKLIRSMRRQYKFRSVLVLIQRWKDKHLSAKNPNSPENLHRISAVENVELRDQAAQSHEQKEQAVKVAEASKLEAAKELDTRRTYALRLKRVNYLSLYTVYDSLNKLRLTAAKWALQVWSAAVCLRPKLRALEDELEKSRSQLASEIRSKTLLEEDFKQKDARIAELEKAMFESVKQKLDLEQRLHANIKNTKVELGELEFKVKAAWEEAEKARGQLQDQVEDLELTVEQKDAALKLIEAQDADLTRKSRSEKRLNKLYDDAMGALGRERVDHHAFNAAVLKTHWMTCKIHEAMKRCQIVDLSVVGNALGKEDPAQEKEHEMHNGAIQTLFITPFRSVSTMFNADSRHSNAV